jgi:hypothetical protein
MPHPRYAMPHPLEILYFTSKINSYFEFGNPLCYELQLNKQNKNTYFDSFEQ